MTHHRASADSDSAAASLALRQLERLESLPDPSDPDVDPTLAATAAGLLAEGPHGPSLVDATGTPSVGGDYELGWSVARARPHAGLARMTVTVRHANDAFATAELVTYRLLE